MEKNEVKWIEGLILLVILVFTILIASFTSKAGDKLFLEEPVCMYESIDNLK